MNNNCYDYSSLILARDSYHSLSPARVAVCGMLSHGKIYMIKILYSVLKKGKYSDAP